MDSRSRSSTSRNEEIYGNTANAYNTSIGRGSDDVPHSLNREHKCNFVHKKGRRKGSHLLRRVAKWVIELGEHDIMFQERGDETPKDFLIEVPLKDNKKEAEEKADIKPTKTELRCEWKHFTNGAASSDGSGAGLMLIDPEGKEYTYALLSTAVQPHHTTPRPNNTPHTHLPETGKIHSPPPTDQSTRNTDPPQFRHPTRANKDQAHPFLTIHPPPRPTPSNLDSTTPQSRLQGLDNQPYPTSEIPRPHPLNDQAHHRTNNPTSTSPIDDLLSHTAPSAGLPNSQPSPSSTLTNDTTLTPDEHNTYPNYPAPRPKPPNNRDTWCIPTKGISSKPHSSPSPPVPAASHHPHK
ncbi:hypothetical protein Tco_1447319 [Tanacetum coccineum]